MNSDSDASTVHDADARALLDRLHWPGVGGCYLASDFFHTIVRPMSPDADGTRTIIIALRPRRAEVSLPVHLAFVLINDTRSNLLHYGTFNRIGQAQIANVTSGLLRLRSASAGASNVHASMLSLLPTAWVVDPAQSAFAADQDRSDTLQFQHADGDLSARLQMEDGVTYLLVTAHHQRWASSLVCLGWEGTDSDGQNQIHEAMLPLIWYQSLECWGGRIKLTNGYPLRFWPPQEPLSPTWLENIPLSVVQSAVAASASLPTRRAWQELARTTDLSSTIRDAIQKQLDMS